MKCTYEDREGRCDADDGLPCPDCERRWAEEAAYWRVEIRTLALNEVAPERCHREMREAGR